MSPSLAWTNAAWNVWKGRRLSAGELQQWRNRKLRRLVRHAFESVPYYRELFQSVGLSPEGIQTTEDLKKIPISSKDDLREAGYDRLLARGTTKETCFACRTSGSCGQPFTTYLSKPEWWTRRLLGARRLLDAGLRPWDRTCVMCDPVQFPSGRFRTWCVSVALPPSEQIAQLRKIQPTVLKAWPSCIRVLLHHAARDARFIRPRLVALSGEECSGDLREEIAARWKTEVFVFYACGELGPIASECRAHQGLHINADQLIVECLSDTPSEPGELVFTSLYGFTMPYIRYRLGDTGILENRLCSCGSAFPLLTSLHGMRMDVIPLPNGRLASVGAVVSTALRPFPTLQQFHLIQETEDRFVLQTVFLEPPSEEILSRMRCRMTELLGRDILLQIAVTDMTAINAARKFGNFTSRLSDTIPDIARAQNQG